MPRALITGITGQDGQYLAELLCAKGYDVFGLIRGQCNPKRGLVERTLPAVQLLEGDLNDMSSLIGALEVAQPDEVYNLAAFSFVGLSWNQPELTGEIAGSGRASDARGDPRPYSERHGKAALLPGLELRDVGQAREVPQRESTPFHPRSPYGAAKAYGHYVTVNYRRAMAPMPVRESHSTTSRSAGDMSSCRGR